MRSRRCRSSLPRTGRRTRRRPRRRTASSCCCSSTRRRAISTSARRAGLEPLPAESATVEVGTITAAEGYEVLQGDELAGIDTELAALVIPAADDRFIRAEGLSLAVELQPTLVYDEANDTFTNIETGTVYSDNGEGSYESPVGRGARAGMADARRLPELLDRPHEPALSRPVRPRLRLDVRLRGDLRFPDVRARAVPRDRAEQADAQAPAHPARAAGASRSRSRPSSVSSSGGDC